MKCILYIPMTLNHKLFQQINNARFANVMNNTAIMNSFNCDNINIARIKMQHHQIMTIITNRNSKLKPMVKTSTKANYTLFTVITFTNINSFT